MFKKLKDVPECLGNIDGVDYEADINVRVTTNPRHREHVKQILAKDKVKTISLDKEYHVHKITSFGDVFDVWIINDLGKEEELCDWFFEDID